MIGILLTRWTIRLALACYVACLATWLLPRQPGSRRATRWLWTLGCAIFLAHVASAFHFYHHWSHAAAYETTARETAELLGVPFGGGIYFSYAFAAVWLAHVAWLWIAAARGNQDAPPWKGGWTGRAVHAYLFFIAVNGAIVFEAGPTRWAGLLACLVLTGLAGRAAYNRLASRSKAPRPTARLAVSLAAEDQSL